MRNGFSAKVPDESGRYVRNPIATISRWKIFDNLRRSLVEVLTFALLFAGWLGLPGGALYWTAVTLFLMFVPTLVQLVFSVGRAYVTKLPGAMRDAFSGFGQGTFIALLNLIYLPHQTLLALDAISRSLVRSFITGQRLLEWETAAEAESSAQSRTPVDRYLALTPLVAVVVGVLVFLRHPESIFVALPILILWGLCQRADRVAEQPAAAGQAAAHRRGRYVPAPVGAEDVALLQPVWRREPQLPDSG